VSFDNNREEYKMAGGFKVGGITLPDAPYMMGAGVCKNPKTTQEWLNVAPVASGSYTQQKREVNQGKISYPDTLEEVRRYGYGLNNYGMPNMGFEAAAEELARINSMQPLIVSVAGFSVKDYLDGYHVFSNLRNVAAIELNFGCPNTEHRTIASFDQETIELILDSISRAKPRKPVWVKFSPYSNPGEIETMAKLVNYYKDEVLLTVVTCNTFPFAYAGKGKIDPSNGRAGLSGPALKHIALGQVHQFREYLHESIDVIGVGGIMSGDDIVEFLDAGAKAVQMTSWPFWAGNPGRFMEELTESHKFLEYLDLNTNKS
jgi:dihydroorotate dehydrogenase (fumarate)